MLTLIIAEAALELVPPTLWKYAAVRRSAERRGKPPSEILLDRSLHHVAMRLLSKNEKRGRPDIVHFNLLLALSSPLNKQGLLKVFIHTFNDKVITVDPHVRIPRNYNRFVGLMEQLLLKGRVPPEGEPLLTVKNQTLRELINDINPSSVTILREKGTLTTPWRLADELSNQRTPAIIVGGFPRGDFEEENLKIEAASASIYPQPLDSWTVVSVILNAFEREWRTYEEAQKPENISNAEKH
ncbi:MAG: 16S rRNA methyltransferase [Candidatus Nezhaarchaeales archaeon]